MAKEKVTLTGSEVNEALNRSMVKGEQLPVGLEEAFDIVEKTDTRTMKALSAAYYDLKENSTYVFIFEGIMETEMSGTNGETKKVKVVKLRDKKGDSYIHGAKVLVSSLEQAQQLPCMVKVETKGKIKTANGSYLDMAVYIFPNK